MTRFAELESQMAALASGDPVPGAEDENSAGEDLIMEIREDLDDAGNIVKTTVIPQDRQAMDNFNNLLAKASQAGPSNAMQIPVNGQESSRGPDIPIPEPMSVKKRKAKKKKKKTATIDGTASGQDQDISRVSPTSDSIIEHEQLYEPQARFNIRETSDGRIEITDDPEGYPIGIIPRDVVEINEIVSEIDWEDEDDSDEESEDEYGRSKSRNVIPLPASLQQSSTSRDSRQPEMHEDESKSTQAASAPDSSARGKKKLVFADDLVQGPSQPHKKTPPRSVLKRESAYPISGDDASDSSLPPTPTIAVPKTSRFKMGRTNTDESKIATRHAQPSQAYKEKLEKPVSETIVERIVPSSLSAAGGEGPSTETTQPEASPRTLAHMSEEEREKLFPRKMNLAGVDLAPDAGTVKAPLSIPKMSEEELAAIRKKRELLGKKHRRRKSADPSHPVRSSSWDESQPMHHHRRPSSGENEQPFESMKAERLERAKEIIKAQEDIAWANAPITPEDGATPESKPDSSSVEVNPLAEAGKELKEAKYEDRAVDAHNGGASTDVQRKESPKQVKADGYSSKGSGSTTPTRMSDYGTGILHSPRPRKPPTPERRGSYHNIPSPLRQEVQPDSVSKEVQFTADVIKKLEPLMENDAEPVVEPATFKERRKPPRQPQRKSSVDPQNITPTARSPPPEGRRPGPLHTEGEGSVTHAMVRATSKSPPPHLAIHDLPGDTPEVVRQALKEEAITPTPQFTNGSSSHEFEKNPMDRLEPKERMNPTNQTVGGIVEHTHPETDGETQDTETDDDEIDDDLHRKEIAQEYHRLRQRMIGAYGGGYIKPEEGEFVPLDEEDAGPGHRVSRFKAARLGGDTAQS